MEINEWEMLCVLNPVIKLGALKELCWQENVT